MRSQKLAHQETQLAHEARPDGLRGFTTLVCVHEQLTKMLSEGRNVFARFLGSKLTSFTGRSKSKVAISFCRERGFKMFACGGGWTSPKSNILAKIVKGWEIRNPVLQ